MSAHTYLMKPPLQCGNERAPWYGQEVGFRDRCGLFRWDHREISEEQKRYVVEHMSKTLGFTVEED
jgi:hypothetical protein